MKFKTAFLEKYICVILKREKTNNTRECIKRTRMKNVCNRFEASFFFQNCRVAVYAQVPEELAHVANAKCIITTPIRIHGFVANVYIKRQTFLSAI